MTQENHEILKNFIMLLEKGELRAAKKNGDGIWETNTLVKENILKVFKNSKLIKFPATQAFSENFIDKELLPAREFHLSDKVRLVPGGSTVRTGAYVGKNVVILPPSYINIGAFIDENTMIDSHVLVGSCAQIGKGVHLSAAVQIGGVLEPIGNRPVIVEDDCFIGANVVLTEGIIVKKMAVIAAGVCLSSSVPIYDCVNEKILFGEIPEGAVVVPGTRPFLKNDWAVKSNLQMNCALIIKYRDNKTTSHVALESALRSF